MNTKLLGLPLLCLCLLVFVPTASAATITVNSTSDSPANDGVCTLHEAIDAANTDTSSGAMLGECAAGSGTDTIAFSGLFTGDVGTSTISNPALPSITQPVTIAGGNCGSPKPCVGIAPNNASGLTVDAPNVTISGVAITGADCVPCQALFVSGSGAVVRNTWLGIRLDQTPEGNSQGIILRGDNAVIGGSGPNDRNVLSATANAAALRIVGGDNTTVQGNYFGTLADGTTTTGVSNASGIQVVGDTAISAPAPVGTLIGGPDSGAVGTCEAPCNVIANNLTSAIDLQGSGGTTIPAGQTTIEGNFVGLGATGTDLGSAAITVGDADDVTVGGDATRRNYVSTEISATTGATNLDVVANFVGLNPAGTARIDDDATVRIGAQAFPITGASVTANRIAQINGGGAAINLGATNSVVQGNVIGIGTSGQDVGGGTVGISVNGGSGNQIGGEGAGQGNVVGNAGTGISASDGSTVAGNVIGTDASEAQPHPITTRGILVSGDSNVIGGTTAASENVIANVGGDAVEIIGDGNDFNRILRNRGSAAAGQEFLELRGDFGVGNGATGPNEGIERPTITAGATSQQVNGTGALPGAIVRVYRTASTAGATGPRDVLAFAGQATADGAGNWTLNCPSAGCVGGLSGAGQVTANQTSATGNSSEMADPKAYTDLAADTQIDSGPAEGSTTGDSTPTFSFSASEPNSAFQCRVDGAPFAGCSGPGATHTPAELTDGPHTFEVRAVDSGLNTDPTAASRSFTVDATAPDTQIDSGPAAGTTIADSTPSFGFSATEGGSSFECRIDGAAFAACSGPGATHTTAALADGQHTFEVRGTDAVGNTDASPAPRAFTVDTTAPDTQIDSGPAAGSTIADSTPSFGFSATEAGSTFECRIDAAAFAACSGPGATHTPAALGDGPHTFEVRATDGLGNADATPATRAFSVDAIGPEPTVDTTAPQTVIASGPAADAVTRDRTPTFGFSATETGSTFQCRVDGAAFAACSGPGASHTSAALGNGRHRFEVRATDAVGNVDTTPASRAFTVDADPPETTITKRPKKRTANRVARFRFRSDESGSTFRCKLDSGRFKRCSSPFRKRVKPGRHILRVRAIDRAGNADPTPAKVRWTVRR